MAKKTKVEHKKMAMLDHALKDQVTALFANLKHQYIFLAEVAQNHPSKQELLALLNDVASCSANLSVQVADGEGLSFTIAKNGVPSNYTFRAVPNGHEFTTLLLAILNGEGIGKKLPDQTISDRIQALQGPISIKSYISLSCTNCPEVVQALNVIAMLNENVRHQIIDGNINKKEVTDLGIQAVPAVFANGKQLHVGRSSLGELLEKLEAGFGSRFDASATAAKQYDVIVIGGGPAGVSAAIYSARKGAKVAIIAEKIGGQVTETTAIENMISVPQTNGTQLAADLKRHLGDYPIDVLENRMIQTVSNNNGTKTLTTSAGETFETPALIIATGASWRKLNVPGESEYIGNGVAFCTHCDGPFYKGKKIAVIGGGNSGLEAAIDLSSIATEVTVLEFMEELKGDQVLQEKLSTLPNVKIIKGVSTKKVIGNGTNVTGLEFEYRHNGQIEQLNVDGIFVQIGLKANSGAFKNIVDTNKMGEIIVDPSCRTTVPGIYAAGDVTVVPYKQIIIAMGEGSKAALSAFEDSIKNMLRA